MRPIVSRMEKSEINGRGMGASIEERPSSAPPPPTTLLVALAARVDRDLSFRAPCRVALGEPPGTPSLVAEREEPLPTLASVPSSSTLDAAIASEVFERSVPTLLSVSIGEPMLATCAAVGSSVSAEPFVRAPLSDVDHHSKAATGTSAVSHQAEILPPLTAASGALRCSSRARIASYSPSSKGNLRCSNRSRKRPSTHRLLLMRFAV